MNDQLVRLFEDTRVPRYTSYPTAPHFKPDADKAALLASLRPDRPLSLYLHVPFCHQLCFYCGCTTKVANSERPIRRYAKLLRREIELLAGRLPRGFEIGHIHWGGGTPSILGAAELGAVMQQLAETFTIKADAEIAIELDPRHVDADLVVALAAHGFNRVSFGIQSFDPDVQKAINRVQDFATVKAAATMLRRAGIQKLSCDLLYGLPHQTREICQETVEQTLHLEPDRLAVFAYAHLPARLKHQRLIDEAALPDARERVAQYHRLRTCLTAHGFEAIGIDHFARPDDPMAIAAREGSLRRNFQGYTADVCDQLLGIGASSISNLPGGYLQNHADVQSYAAAIEAGELPQARGLAVDTDDLCRKALIEAVMCQGSVDISRIAKHFGVNVDHVEPEPERFARLAACGLVERDGHIVAMAPKREPFVRLLAACFDRYLDPHAGLHAAAL